MQIIKQLSTNLIEKRPGVFLNSITGIFAQMAYIRLKPGVSTFHSHPSEQMGYILSGEVELMIDEKSVVCRPGDAYYIPQNAKHGFKVLDNKDLEYIEVFSPVKEETKG